MQSLAVTFGAQMVQDMWHETNESGKGCEIMHSNRLLLDKTVMNDFPLKGVVSNSRHHQIVSDEGIDNNSMVEVIARYNGKQYYPFKSSIEAIAIKDYPIAAVQWHPEDVKDDNSTKFVEKVINTLIETKKSLIKE